MQRNKNMYRLKKEFPLYLMTIPGLLFFLVYHYFPIYGVIMAFQDFRLARGFSSKWVGFENFRRFFTSPFFPMVMGNTMLLSLLKIIIGFPAPIILALMLNELKNQKFKKIIQTVVYLPHFISWVVAGNLIMIFFSLNTGIDSGVIPYIFDRLFNIEIKWIVEPWPFRWLLVFSDIWKSIGWGSIIYLAALTSIDPTLYEAAVIDGAKKGQLIIYITIPALIPLITIMFLMRIGGILNAGFEQVFILQNSLVYRSSEIIDTYSYSRGFLQGEYGFGSAVGLFKSLIGLVLVLYVIHLAHKHGEGSLI